MKAKTIYWIDAAACRNEGTEWYDDIVFTV